MYGGPIIVLRQTLQYTRYCKPWQQALFSTSLITIGMALIVMLGAWIGILPAAIGILLTGQITKASLQARRSGPAQTRRPSSGPHSAQVAAPAARDGQRSP